MRWHFAHLCLLLVVAISTEAALPPLSEKHRSDWATVIASGVVEHVNSSLVKEESAISTWSIHHQVFDAVLRVSRVAKAPTTADSICISPGDSLSFSFRKIKLPDGMVGAQGQSSIPEAGTHITIFAQNNAKENRYQNGWMKSAHGTVILVEPNGFEVNTENDLSESSRPPRLLHSRRHGFSGDGPLKLVRDVPKAECDWLERDLKAGDVMYLYKGATYGVVGPSGVAVTLSSSGEPPFFELPASALAEV